TFPARVQRSAGRRVSPPRQSHRGHPTRSHLSGPQKINFSTVFCGQGVGIKEFHDIWLVSFMDYDLGFFDLEKPERARHESPCRGAAGSVTDSKYLVEAAGKRLLVDCGIFQGSQELQDRNYKPLPVGAKTIDYLVLTHAHLDHTGWLPVLAKSGYRGPIFANP